jgi:hypothetical protein
MRVLIHSRLKETSYGELEGRQVYLPRDRASRPNKDALKRRRLRLLNADAPKWEVDESRVPAF